MTNIQIVIPFRDRGQDLRRAANLDVVTTWWYGHGLNVKVYDDGLTGDAQFNRHKAYNRAVKDNPDADVFIFTEADMLIPVEQIAVGVRQAAAKPGLVVPFMQYRYLSDEVTGHLRETFADLTPQELASWMRLPAINPSSIFTIHPESIMDNGRSIGAVNIVSRETLELTGGYTEATHGNWYDDNIIEEGFAYLTGSKTRFIPGPAVHLYHLPGWKGDHLTAEDRAATAHNKQLLGIMREDIKWDHRDHVVDLMKKRS